jgi:hypothetical protein
MQAWKVSVLMVAVSAAPLGMTSAAAQEAPVVLREVIEPASGARVRLLEAPAGEVAFDVSARGVSVAKHIGPAGATTRMTTGDGTVSLRLTPSRIIVEDRRGRVTLEGDSRDEADALRARLASSGVVRRAIDLLGDVRLGPTSPVTPVLLATRRFLLEATGLPTGVPAAADVFGMGARAGSTTRVGDGPGECWDEYAKEAIAAYTEFEQCLDGVSWYQFYARGSCELVYEMRAVGAFSWWTACVGFDNWKG